MKFKGKINSLFGESVIRDLRRLIKESAIEKETIRSLADEMGVPTVYAAYKDRDPFDPVTTMEHILDEWYQQTISQMSPEDAWKLLTKVLGECCSPYVQQEITKGRNNTYTPPPSSQPQASPNEPPAGPNQPPAVHLQPPAVHLQQVTGDNSKLFMQSGGTMNISFKK